MHRQNTTNTNGSILMIYAHGLKGISESAFRLCTSPLL